MKGHKNRTMDLLSEEELKEELNKTEMSPRAKRILGVVEDDGYSIYNRTSILKSKKLGCYDCCRIFSLEDIHEDDWCDDGETLTCPYCGDDTVIGDASGLPITELFLKAASKATGLDRQR